MTDRVELLTRVAYLYYKEDFTQQEIAVHLGLSRPKITRLLKEARQSGIVRIDITTNLPPELDEAHNIHKLFNVHRVIVVPNEKTQAGTINAIRSALAKLMLDNLRNFNSVGFSFSQTIGNITDYFHNDTIKYNGSVCDLMGAMMGFPMPYTVSADVARRIGGTLYPISAPIMVLDPQDRNTYLTDPNIKKTMEVAQNVEYAVVGIGEFTIQNILYRSGYINEQTINNLRYHGIVGEMCMRFFNIDGEHIPSEIDSRVISIPWETLASTRNLTVVSSGSYKVQSTLGALRTGIIHTLITDLDTARKILELNSR